MKKTAMTKLLSLLLCITLIVGGCGEDTKNKKDKNSSSPTGVAGEQQGTSEPTAGDDKEPVEEFKLELSELAYAEDQQEYIDLHLDFLGGSQYADSCLVPGGAAKVMKDGYQSDNLDKINGMWDALNKIEMALDSGKVEFENSYDPLVGQLFQTMEAQEAYEDAYDRALMQSMKDILSAFSQVLKNEIKIRKELPVNKIDSYKDTAETLDKILLGLEKRLIDKNIKSEDLCQSVWKEAKEKIQSTIDEDDLKRMKTTMKGLSYADKIMGIVSESFNEMMDQYIIVAACSRANEEYLELWKSILNGLKAKNDSESKKIAASIEYYVKKIELAQEDTQKAMMELAAHAAGKNILEYGTSLAIKGMVDTLSKVETIGAILQGLSQGVALGNKITNLDDVAYNGKMLIGCGVIAEVAFDVMTESGKKLEKEQNFSNAIMFDEAFNLYKKMELLAIEYAFEYEEALRKAPLSLLNRGQVIDSIVGEDLLMVEKAKWQERNCHAALAPMNNGGHVVGYGSRVFMWGYTGASYEGKSEFPLEYEIATKNPLLVVRKNAGALTLLPELMANNRIYIFNNHLYFNDSGIVGTCTLNGENYHKLGDLFTIEDIVPDSSRMIVTTKDGYQVMDENGDLHPMGKEVEKLIGRDPMNDDYYFLEYDGRDVTIKAISLRDYKVSKIVTIGMSDIKGDIDSLEVGNPIFYNRDLYLVISAWDKKWNLDSGLHQIDLISHKSKKVGKPLKRAPLIYKGIYLLQNYGEPYIVYSYGSASSSSISKAKIGDNQLYCISKDTCYTEVGGLGLSKLNEPVWNEEKGCIEAYLDENGEYTTILTAETANELGITWLSAKGCPWMDVVGDYAYLCLQGCVDISETECPKYAVKRVWIVRVDLSKEEHPAKIIYDSNPPAPEEAK